LEDPGWLAKTVCALDGVDSLVGISHAEFHRTTAACKADYAHRRDPGRFTDDSIRRDGRSRAYSPENGLVALAGRESRSGFASSSARSQGGALGRLYFSSLVWKHPLEFLPRAERELRENLV
jgi:hypothetical protein